MKQLRCFKLCLCKKDINMIVLFTSLPAVLFMLVPDKVYWLHNFETA